MVRLKRSIFAAAILSAALAAAASGQGGGFSPGELVLYNPWLNGNVPTSGGLTRIDPSSGTVTPLLDLTGSSQSAPGSMAYDPYRDRVLFVGAFPTVNDPRKLWAIDAAGTTTDLGFADVPLWNLTPASGGRVYCQTSDPSAPLRYLDAGNVLRPLLEVSGVQPFVPFHDGIQRMVYDPGTNALFVAALPQSVWTCGGPSSHLIVHRLPLSKDGARVVVPTACAEVLVDFEVRATGFSRGPGGALLLVVGTGNSAQRPRMQLVDPVTMAVTPWAANGTHPGAGYTDAGTWSSLLGKAVILDSWQNVLRAFAQGESGGGSVLTAPGLVSSLGAGEVATLVEVPPDLCGGTVGLHCTAKTTSGGCLPAIATAGSPSASAGTGFLVEVHDVPSGQPGVFLHSTHGPLALPFQGGFLCVHPPSLRLPPQVSGGSGPCGGSYSVDFNAYAASGANPALVHGVVVHGQFWFRDPLDPFGSGLSGGVAFTLCP